jgi:ATP-dependent exoDNAse (exonuclease V) alpha subunit
MTKTKATRLEGLEHNIIPVQPVSTHYRIKISSTNGKNVQRTIKRQQYALTPAYALTDYWSQGVTIPYVILDIAPPPTGTLNLFNLYVALSRSCGRNTIQLLRDFDDEMFRKPHNVELIAEDGRLKELDISTQLWYNTVM